MGMGPGSGISPADIRTIKASTDPLPGDPADASDVAAQNAVLAGYTDTLEASAVTIAGYTDSLEAAVAALAAQNTVLAGYTDTLEAAAAVIDAFHDVSAIDAVDNAQMRDVLGNKEDTASRTPATISLMALLRQVLAETSETERHLHNVELWFGPAAVAIGENHIADLLGEVGGDPSGVITSFRVTSGANKTWGTAVQIWGATDYGLLPATKQAFQDAHRLRVTVAETDKHEWLLRIIVGATAAAGVTARTYGIIPIFVENTNKVLIPVDLITERVIAGSKIWVQLLHISDNDAEYCDFQFGIHGYPD